MLLNLLDPVMEERLIRNPKLLIEMVNAAGKSINHVFIDEVQKIPKLLDLVHLLIETTSLKFILTGSSARKLKHGGANLLAGRAFVYNLYPFSFFEINNLSLKQVLEWGLLPKIFHLRSKDEKTRFLQSYAYTYLKEEIWAEQFIENLDPFNHFFRKRLNGKPKFYFFDTGVVRALRNILNVSLEESTSLYGETFEHFIILECIKLANYFRSD